MCNHYCQRKAKSVPYNVCVSVALVIQHAKCMYPIILSSVACLAVPYFYIYLTNSTIIGKKLLNIKCVFSFSLQILSKTFLILRRTEQDIIK